MQFLWLIQDSLETVTSNSITIVRSSLFQLTSPFLHCPIFICSLTHSIIHSFVRSLGHNYLFIYLFIYFFIYSFSVSWSEPPNVDPAKIAPYKDFIKISGKKLTYQENKRNDELLKREKMRKPVNVKCLTPDTNVFALSSARFFVFFASVVILQSDYFSVGSRSLN